MSLFVILLRVVITFLRIVLRALVFIFKVIVTFAVFLPFLLVVGWVTFKLNELGAKMDEYIPTRYEEAMYVWKMRHLVYKVFGIAGMAVAFYVRLARELLTWVWRLSLYIKAFDRTDVDSEGGGYTFVLIVFLYVFIFKYILLVRVPLPIIWGRGYPPIWIFHLPYTASI